MSTTNRRPNIDELRAAHAVMVEGLTLQHAGNSAAWFDMLDRLDADEMRHLATVALSSLYAATDQIAQVRGLPVERFLQVLAIQGQTEPMP